MNVVLTGATGFVGRHLLRALLDAGHRVRALARRPDELGEPTHAALTRTRWSVAEPGDVVSALEGAEVLFHAAAFIPPDHDDPRYAAECLRVNAEGTLALLEAAVSGGVRRVVHLSSGNVYFPRRRRLREDAATYPSPRAPYYLSSKLAGEIYADHFRRTRDLSVSILRVSSVYGPGMGSRGLIPAFASRLARGERIDVEDGGRHTVDPVHVDDVVRAAMLAAEAAADGIFNVGSAVEIDVLGVARVLLDLFGADASAMRLEPAGDADGPPGFPWLDVERARSLLGYRPRSLREGLADYLEREGWLGA